MMPVNKDANGNRFVKAEVEVPGAPEEVWEAIATGPGISSWFVPSTVDGRAGGQINMNFGPGMDSVSAITAWDPPRRLVAESPGELGPNGPTIATEWTVEAQSGGTCVVRVVHRWFTDSDAWDNQFEGHEQGWSAFFRILRTYLTDFRGQPSTAFQLMSVSAQPVSQAWQALVTPLGLQGVAGGHRVTTNPDAPRLVARVEFVGPAEYPELLLRLYEPTGGTAHMFAMPMGGSVCLFVRQYLYGARAAAEIAQAEREWTAWMHARFPEQGAAEPVS
jgi:uncharacterized protein YndB with AHSA1/START domain